MLVVKFFWSSIGIIRSTSWGLIFSVGQNDQKFDETMKFKNKETIIPTTKNYFQEKVVGLNS